MINKSKNYIGSIQKMIKIIETYTQDEVLQSIQELSEKTGFAKTTVHRIVNTLVYEGWMFQDVYSKRYGLGYGLLGYENLILVQESLIKLCDPIMKNLRDELNETVTLVVIEKNNGRCIHKLESEHYIKLASRVGKPMPLYAGASSKSILAFMNPDYIENYLRSTELVKFTENTIVDIEIIKNQLNNIRKNKYVVSVSEVDMDTFTAAAPIFKKGDIVLGSISISAPSYRIDEDMKNRMIEKIIEASMKITKKIQGN